MASQPQAALTSTNRAAYSPKTRGPQWPQIQHRKKRLLLTAFARLLTVTEAAKAAGVDRCTHYGWMDSDPEYAQAFADLEERKVEHLENQLYKRGADGVDKPVFHQGEICGHVKEYSDTAAIFMLKAARPEKYRERFQVDANVTGTLLVPAAAIDHVMARALELRKAGSIELEASEQEGDAAPGNNTP